MANRLYIKIFYQVVVRNIYIKEFYQILLIIELMHNGKQEKTCEKCESYIYVYIRSGNKEQTKLAKIQEMEKCNTSICLFKETKLNKSSMDKMKEAF